MLEILYSVFAGIVAGATYGITSFIKKKAKDDSPDFELSKLGTTVIIGAIAGGTMAVVGGTIDLTYTYLLNFEHFEPW